MQADVDIDRAADRIRQGGIVAFPTETVYGLGANALDARAVARVFEVKGRPRFDPLIVHVATADDAAALARHLPDAAHTLAERFWPGPLTLVVGKKPTVPDIVTAGLPSVALRQPDHPLALELIRKAGVPIAAPSANLFGRTSPTTADHVREQLGEKIDGLLDGGPCRVGVESTIVSLLGSTPVLLRPGGVPLEEIERLIGPVELPPAGDERPLAPGRLPQHYAPQTPLRQGRETDAALLPGRVGLLSFHEPTDAARFAAVEVLSKSGDLREAAANLFAALRRLDAQSLDLIVAEPVPETGLGRAIMDRLRRAAHEG